MTTNTNDDTVTEMEKPNITGDVSNSGEPEASEETATDKVEDTTDQESTTEQLEALEKERKQLARINAKSGERAKEAKLAALSAIAQLDTEKAKTFLEDNPELADDFNEKYPDHFTESVEEIPQTKSSDTTIDRDLLKAEILADTAKAAKTQEQETASINFAVDNKLNKEEQQSLKKVASALVSADSSTSFDEALGIVYQNKFGKAPSEPSSIIPGGSADKPVEHTKEELEWWGKTVDTNITPEQAAVLQKGADEFHKTMTSGGGKPK